MRGDRGEEKATGGMCLDGETNERMTFQALPIAKITPPDDYGADTFPVVIEI
jgi:hypothetical protein